MGFYLWIDQGNVMQEIKIIFWNKRIKVQCKTFIFLDINTAPVITNLPLPTSIYVHENSALGLLLYTVKNLDVNSADTVTFSMSTSPTEALNYFDVNTASKFN